MRTLAWNRTQRITETRTRIWSYLSPASVVQEQVLLEAAALLQWPERDVATLGRLQFLLCDEVGLLLDALPSLVRTLTTSSSREEEWDHERLRGPVVWSRTLSLRQAGGPPTLWVTAPARRDYQTVENRMLVQVLDAVLECGRASGWGGSQGQPAALVQARVATAEHWLQHRQLQQIERVPLSPRDAMRARSGRARIRYAPAIAAFDKYQSLVRALDRAAVREAVENAGLVTASEAVLFELLCLFNVVDALKHAGWAMSPVRLFSGRVLLKGSQADGRAVELTYQSKPAQLQQSRYVRALNEHGFVRQPDLRPDMTLRWTAPDGRSRWLMVECKLSESQGGEHAARQALVDLLAYRRAFSETIEPVPLPYGLGLAWGAGLQPNPNSEVMLASPDTIVDAVAAVVF